MRRYGETMWLIGFSLALAGLAPSPAIRSRAAKNAAKQRAPDSASRRVVGHGAWDCAPQPISGFPKYRSPSRTLPKDLDGLRIVQITDIHLSPFLSEREFAAAIDMANETRANIALVTGDLITRPGDPLDACLRQLARLRADAGVLGCLGNHEIYTRRRELCHRTGPPRSESSFCGISLSSFALEMRRSISRESIINRCIRNIW